MGAVGLEPTRPKGTGFTVQRASQLLITPMKKKEKSTEIICFNETLWMSYGLTSYPHLFPDVCFMLGYLGEPLLTIETTRLFFI